MTSTLQATPQVDHSSLWRRPTLSVNAWGSRGDGMPGRDEVTTGEIARRLDEIRAAQLGFEAKFNDFAEKMPATYVSKEVADERYKAISR